MLTRWSTRGETGAKLALFFFIGIGGGASPSSDDWMKTVAPPPMVRGCTLGHYVHRYGFIAKH